MTADVLTYDVCLGGTAPVLEDVLGRFATLPFGAIPLGAYDDSAICEAGRFADCFSVH